jgi:hypothetical protein
MAPEVKREVMLLSIGGADVFIVVKKEACVCLSNND